MTIASEVIILSSSLEMVLIRKIIGMGIQITGLQFHQNVRFVQE